MARRRNLIAATFVCLSLLAPLPLRADWRADADARIEKNRKGDFSVTLLDPSGKPRTAQATATLTRHHFMFGSCVIGDPTRDTADQKRYEQYLLDHFSVIVCENGMKWWGSEKERGQLDLKEADQWARWAADHDMPLRGHSLFWEKPKWTQPWLHALDADELRKEVEKHLELMVTRYKGKVFCWDVDNEILDGSFYPDKLGPDIQPWFYKRTAQLDPDAKLFVNEYSILTIDHRVARYIDLIKRIQAAGGKVDGIGVQDHGLQRFVVEPPATQPAAPRGFFRRREAQPAGPGPDDILRSLDQLAELKLPIHLTELSSITNDVHQRAQTIDMIFRIGFSHPQVEAIVLWGFWSKRHFKGDEAAMVNADWTNTEAGDRLDDLLLKEWRTTAPLTPAADGQASFRGFYGTYTFTTSDGLVATAKLTPDTRAVTVKLAVPPPAPATRPATNPATTPSPAAP